MLELASLYSDLLPTQGQRGAFFVLAGLLGSFGFIRTSTRLMRSPKVTWWPGSVTSGDLHVHHLVFGIIAMMATGFLAFALDPGSPGVEILGALFGIGMGLTLDEYALWLYLDDVYWKEEGRKSFEAVVVAAVLMGLVLLGASPIEPGEEGFLAVALTLGIHLVFVAIVILKGKLLYVGLFAVFVPLMAVVSTFRLARPNSAWARRFYKSEAKRARAERRAEKVKARQVRWNNWLAGAPSIPSAPKE